MHDRFKAHIETALASLERRIAKAKKPLDRGAIERQIGRLLERNSRAAGAFSISITEDATHPVGDQADPHHTGPSGPTGRGSPKGSTSCAPTSPSGPTRRCGRPTSSSPRPKRRSASTSPIWRSGRSGTTSNERIKAHILICFIAYALWKTLQQWQSKAGLGHAPRTILTEFSRIHAADIVLPLAQTNPTRTAHSLRGASRQSAGDPA